jgi:hypothetical protein
LLLLLLLLLLPRLPEAGVTEPGCRWLRPALSDGAPPRGVRDDG